MSTRRKQNTRCDPCAKARLGCDARQRIGGPCYNCVRRGKDCVSKWERSKPQASYQSHSLVATQAINQHQNGTVLDDILFKVFSEVQEMLWLQTMSFHSSPLVPIDATPADSVAKFLLELDRASSRLGRQILEPMQLDRRKSPMLSGIRVFALRILLVDLNGKGSRKAARNVEQIQNDACLIAAWRNALAMVECCHKSIPNYHSVFTLYFLGMISLSMQGNRPSNFTQTCVTKASDYLLQLRQDSMKRPGYSYSIQENMAYWLGFQSETILKFTDPSFQGRLPCFPIEHNSWKVVRDRTSAFDRSFRYLHDTVEILSDNVMQVALQHANLQKTMILSNFTNRRNSLMWSDYHQIMDSVLEDIRTFEEILRPILQVIGRDLWCIRADFRLLYFITTMHYCGVLLLVTNEIDSQCFQVPYWYNLSELDCVQAIVSVLEHERQISHLDNGAEPELLTLDPNPDTLTRVILLAGVSLFKVYDRKDISILSAKEVLSVLTSSLEKLRRVALTAKPALDKLNHNALSRGFYGIN